MEYYREKSVGDGGRNWREEECRWGTGGRCWGSTSCLGYGALTEDRFRFCVSDSGDSAAKSSAGPSTTPHAAATSRCIGRRSGTQQPGPPPTPPQSHILTERGSVSFFGVSLSMRLVCCSVLFFLFLFLFFFPLILLAISWLLGENRVREWELRTLWTACLLVVHTGQEMNEWEILWALFGRRERNGLKIG